MLCLCNTGDSCQSGCKQDSPIYTVLRYCMGRIAGEKKYLFQSSRTQPMSYSLDIGYSFPGVKVGKA
jgi:hypothetical protein